MEKSRPAPGEYPQGRESDKGMRLSMNKNTRFVITLAAILISSVSDTVLAKEHAAATDLLTGSERHLARVVNVLNGAG